MNVDLAKVDNKNLTCVVVALKAEIEGRGKKCRIPKLDNPKYRVATQHGYLNRWMDRIYVNRVENVSVEAAGL